MEDISRLISTLGVIATAIYGFIQLQNFSNSRKEELDWKRSQETWNATREFIASDEYLVLSDIFDVSGSHFSYKGSAFDVPSGIIASLLRTRDMHLTDEEVAFRSCVDRLSQNLTRLEFGLRSGFLDFGPIEAVLKYDASNWRRSKALLNYLEFFEFQDVLMFFERFDREPLHWWSKRP